MAHLCRGALRERSVWSWTEASAPSTPAASPTHDEIAALAYSYWEARGKEGGSATADWLHAESELRKRALGPSKG